MVEVVAALLFNERGEVLICQRPQGKMLASLWEFPGGKMEMEESPQEALVRECQEELGLDITVKELFFEVTHKYTEMEVHIRFFTAVPGEESPKGLEHQAMVWTAREDLDDYPFCPADKNIIAALKKVNPFAPQ